MVGKNYYTKDIEEKVQKNMDMIKKGVVRNHKLKNGAAIHTGELEEKESGIFCDFLTTKNYAFLAELRGHENA